MSKKQGDARDRNERTVQVRNKERESHTSKPGMTYLNLTAALRDCYCLYIHGCPSRVLVGRGSKLTVDGPTNIAGYRVA